MSSKKLTLKQESFCIEYLEDQNGAEAYLRAGYKCTRESASAAAALLLRNPEIQARIYKLREEIAEASIAPLAEVVTQLSNIVRADISNTANYSDNGMTAKSFKDLPKEVRSSVGSISFSENISEDGSVSAKKVIKLHSKTAAAALLFKFHGVDNDWNKIRAGLRQYGIEMVADESSKTGWRLEPSVTN